MQGLLSSQHSAWGEVGFVDADCRRPGCPCGAATTKPNEPTLADPRLTHLRGTGFGNYSAIPLRPRNGGQKRTPTATQKPGLTPRGPFARQDPPSPPCSTSPDFWKGREGPTKASDALTKESVRWSFGGDLGRGCRRQGSGNARRATETSPRAAI